MVKSSASGNAVSDTKLLQHEFWEQLIEAGRDKSQLSYGRKALPQHWYNLSFGTSRAHIALTTNTQKGLIGCEVYIINDKALFDLFAQSKKDIEAEVGVALDWKRLDDAKACRIITTTAIDITDRENWEQASDWLIKSADNFAKAFSKRL